MHYRWHEPKRQATITKRGIDFAQAKHVFAGSIFTFEDEREDYDEQRWVTLGLLREKVVVIVHTESDDHIHIISMREASKNEQLLFFSNFR